MLRQISSVRGQGAPGDKAGVDPFDAPDYSPIKLINNLYPDEASLTDLDKFIAVLKKQIVTVDKEIFQAVRSQGGAHTRARQELEAAQQQISELFERMRGIQRKADESERLVQDICKDIRKLDYAKRHLTNGITALRRLAMLKAAVADLEGCAGRRDSYRKSANLIEAIHQLMEYFSQYQDIPQVKSLSARLSVLEAQLQECVLDDFRVLMGTVDIKVSPDNLDRLSAACMVVDALGPQVRDQLLDWMCDREMNIYTMFSSSGGMDMVKLDRFDRRFQWFRSRMEERKAEWAVFPEQWRVPTVLCLTFCKITKAHLARLLSDEESAINGLKSDISPLIKAVVSTNKFEKEMAALFGGGTDQEDEDAEVNDEASASEARKRLERIRQKHKVEEARRQKDQAGEKARAEREAVRGTFEGVISEAFEPSLHLYVAEEERELVAYLETLLKEEAERHWQPTDDEVDARILPSANKLFLKVRGSLTRCVRMISRGPTLLALSNVFQRVLAAYCAALLHRLPKTAGGQTSVAPPYNGTDWHVKLPPEEERVVCHVLHTAEFCSETTEALAAACLKDIKPALADQVDMSDEQSGFQSLSGACMSVLSLGINTQLDVALQELGRVRWDVVENPGDDSMYVNTIRKALLDAGPRLAKSLDTTTFAFLCDKVLRMFLPRFHDAVGRCKRISDKGTLQLSIDCDAVRRALHEFPRAARDTEDKGEARYADLVALQGGAREEDTEATGPFAGYHAYVEREMGGLINMVKVLQSKAENLVDTFLLLMPANAQSLPEFARVCDMKGLSRQQQQQLFQLFQVRTSGAADPALIAALPGGSSSSALAANLSAFKLNMNNITALASNISFPKMGSSPSSPRGLFARSLAGQTALGTGAGLSQSGGPQRGSTASISAAAENMASRTKDTFAKVGTFIGTGFSRLGGQDV